MARIIGRLTARNVANARPAEGRRAVVLADGGNLFLQCTVATDGHVRRSWLLQYERDGVRHAMGLGNTATRGLASARAKARELRLLLLDGVDPIQAKRQARTSAKLEAAKAMTFGQCVGAYLEAHDAAWENARHRQQWRQTLGPQYCSKIINLPVAAIDTDLVLHVLTPIWKTKTETATRLRGRIERVLAWAKGRELRSGENPARWSGHLSEMLAAPGKLAKVRHHPALAYAELPAFMHQLRERQGTAARALEFLILTAARSGEVRGATWGEIDLTARVWVVPPERMKARRVHRVPLSSRAVDILRGLPRHGDRVFKLPERALRRLLKSMGPAVTVHGFRSAFRDWAAETTNHPREICEAALAHTVGNQSERAYARSDLLDRRRRLMDEWAAFCARPVRAGDNIVAMRAP